MSLKGLKRAVEKLAEGRYHSVRHEIMEYRNHDIREEWGVYISEVGWGNGASPRLALAELEGVLEKIDAGKV